MKILFYNDPYTPPATAIMVWDFEWQNITSFIPVVGDIVMHQGCQRVVKERIWLDANRMIIALEPT
jgi:hypothetical protein